MSAYTKIICKKGETLVIRDEEIIHRIVADEITVDVPISFDNHSVTENVHLYELAGSWIREVKK